MVGRQQLDASTRSAEVTRQVLQKFRYFNGNSPECFRKIYKQICEIKQMNQPLMFETLNPKELKLKITKLFVQFIQRQRHETMISIPRLLTCHGLRSVICSKCWSVKNDAKDTNKIFRKAKNKVIIITYLMTYKQKPPKKTGMFLIPCCLSFNPKKYFSQNLPLQY